MRVKINNKLKGIQVGCAYSIDGGGTWHYYDKYDVDLDDIADRYYIAPYYVEVQTHTGEPIDGAYADTSEARLVVYTEDIQDEIDDDWPERIARFLHVYSAGGSVKFTELEGEFYCRLMTQTRSYDGSGDCVRMAALGALLEWIEDVAP